MIVTRETATMCVPFISNDNGHCWLAHIFAVACAMIATVPQYFKIIVTKKTATIL